MSTSVRSLTGTTGSLPCSSSGISVQQSTGSASRHRRHSGVALPSPSSSGLASGQRSQHHHRSLLPVSLQISSCCFFQLLVQHLATGYWNRFSCIFRSIITAVHAAIQPALFFFFQGPFFFHHHFFSAFRRSSLAGHSNHQHLATTTIAAFQLDFLFFISGTSIVISSPSSVNQRLPPFIAIAHIWSIIGTHHWQRSIHSGTCHFGQSS